MSHEPDNHLLLDEPPAYDYGAEDAACDAADALNDAIAVGEVVNPFMPSLFDILAGATGAQAKALNPAAVIPKRAALNHYKGELELARAEMRGSV